MLEFVFTDGGLARETHYLDKDGNPQANADNVFGFTSQFDGPAWKWSGGFSTRHTIPRATARGLPAFA